MYDLTADDLSVLAISTAAMVLFAAIWCFYAGNT